MKIAVIKEVRANEFRVASTPEVIKKFVENGFEVIVEKDAGLASGISNKDYESVGAKTVSRVDVLKNADMLLSLWTLEEKELKKLQKSCVHICNAEILSNSKIAKIYADNNIDLIAMEMMPRISRAQSSDILSSQSNLAGYRAVIDAIYNFNKAVPMMMTAAGTIAPARVLVMGAGVAGLQAIATAKRLGAVVYASDVRPAVKEQVESLGGRFVEVDGVNEDGETKDGYAKEMSDEYKKRQAEAVAKEVEKADIVITTALIPGRPAPKLISKDMIKTMKAGSVIVDMAVASGGNVDGSQSDEIVETNGIKVIGYDNLSARVSRDASKLYAKNILNFVTPFINSEEKIISFDFEDELVKGTAISWGGKVLKEESK